MTVKECVDIEARIAAAVAAEREACAKLCDTVERNADKAREQPMPLDVRRMTATIAGAAMSLAQSIRARGTQ